MELDPLDEDVVPEVVPFDAAVLAWLDEPLWEGVPPETVLDEPVVGVELGDAPRAPPASLLE